MTYLEHYCQVHPGYIYFPQCHCEKCMHLVDLAAARSMSVSEFLGREMISAALALQKTSRNPKKAPLK